MKSILAFCVICIIVTVLTYAPFVLFCGEANPLLWHVSVRIIAGLIWFCWMIAAMSSVEQSK